ncbi:Hypothetical predicted protein, partial [Paramuricea clavata]
MFVGYPDGTKGFKLYYLTNKTFIRSRDVIFEERSFHKFKCEQSSESNSEVYYPAKEDSQVNLPIGQVQIQTDDENMNAEENPQPILKNNVPLQENNNRVGA